MVAGMHWATPEERRKLGQARRKQVGRQQQDELHPKARRATALELLERAERGRVAALVRLKRERMAASPFGYFRGAAPVMAADLAVLPNTGILCQICGDAHVRNVGAFAAPDGRLVFDINDFDETIRGPFEWDLKRMAASLVVAGREAGHKEAGARGAAQTCVERYGARMRALAKMPTMDAARVQVHRMETAEPVEEALKKAERATPMHLLETLTEPAGGHSGGARRFKEDKPVLTRLTGAQAQRVLAALGPYRATLEPERQHLLALYRPVDVAFKAVGTGSVGLRDYCIYFEGNGPGDPLFLQVKEEAASVYAAYVPAAHEAVHGTEHQGRRVVDGHRAMQVESDPLLGWTQMGGRDYLVRQLNDHKGSIEMEDLSGGGLGAFAEICGELLARGHARSGDPLAIAGYLGSGGGFAEAVAKWGATYADQTEKDWEALKRKMGRGATKASAKGKDKSK
ncbi:MAG TPA: DUF2252 domain-containing protein [Terracidiphilus sp.]|nr:DUF2252 domain-containing protein [Terracidiphilus sp.]